MATQVEGLHPFATPNGESAPLDIIRPRIFSFWNLVTDTEISASMPSNLEIMYLYSDVDVIIKLDNLEEPGIFALVEAAQYEDTFFLPANTIMVVDFAPIDHTWIHFWPLATGRIYVNSVQRWSAMNQPLQASFG